MTVSIVYSPNMTNIIADPRVKNAVAVDGGFVRSNSGVMAVATTSIDEAGDIIKLERLPSHAVLQSVQLSNTDLDSNGSPALAFHLGGYYGTGTNAGTVIDADGLAVASAVLQAATKNSELLLSGVTLSTSIAYGKKLWELLGLTSDPKCDIDIAMTISTAAGTAAAGTIAWKIQWTLGN